MGTMKRILYVIVVILACLAYIGVSYAGEVEEKKLQIQVTELQMKNLEITHKIFNSQLMTQRAELKALIEKAAKKPAKKKKGGDVER